MSDISIPGVSSRYNTTKLIDDLMEAERIPLARMEEDVTAFESEKKNWQQVNRNMAVRFRESFQREKRRILTGGYPYRHGRPQRAAGILCPDRQTDRHQ